MHKPWLKALLAILLATLALCHTAVMATQPAIVIDDQFTERAIGLDLAILEDPTAQLSLDDVRSATYASQFTPSTKENPGFGFTKSAYWARFTLEDARSSGRPSSDLPLALTLAFAPTDLATLWCTNKQGAIVVEQRTGDHVPLEEWPILYRNPSFEITPATQSCWLRLQTDESMQFPLTLSTQATFADLRVKDSTIQALYFGALLVMFVYNGLLAATTRSWAYATYTFFLLSIGLFQCTFNGISYQLLWPNAIGFADKVLPFFIACGALSACLFAIVLLELRQAAPRFYKFGVVMVALFALHLVTPWLLPYSLAIRTVLVTTIFGCIFILGSGITLAWRGVRLAQIYVAAWFFFLLGTALVILASLGLLPTNTMTRNAQQLGSAIEFVVLSLALSYRIKTLQNSLLSTQKELLESIKAESAAQTESLLAQARSDQALAQSKAQQAQNNALQIQAELARKDAELAQKEADYTKEQLQQADKMASLGQLVASVTHEINTPIGAISSSGSSITEALGDVITQLPPLLQRLDSATSQLLVELLQQGNSTKRAMSSREERAVVKKVTEQLDAAGVEGARQKAGLLVQFNAQDEVTHYQPLLQHPESDHILQAARSLINALGNARNVNVAVERVTKIVKALKSFSHFNIGTEKIDANLTEGMETVLTIYQGQTKVGVEVVRNYDSIPSLRCYPDELNQVWTNLIHNALQAMNHEGTLTIGIRKEGGNAVVSVGDSGCGIPEEIRGKIFDVFFTTKPAGVGSGLGLDIVKKIIDKHQGRIDLQSEVRVGTTFSVYLPYAD
jgi:signal transduction histidine kinase